MSRYDVLSGRTGLIILHPLVITFLLLSSYPIIHDIPIPFWFIILSSFILSIVLMLLQKRINDKVLLYIQFMVDIILISIVIHFSHAAQSMFPLLYILVIILSSFYLFRSGAYLISMVSVASLLIIIIIELQTSNIPVNDIMQRFYVFGLLFLLTGILSGSLSERYERRTEEANRLRITTEEIFNNLPTGIITIDNAGSIIYSNIPEGRIKTRLHLHLAKFLKDKNIPTASEIKFGKRYYVITCARIFDNRAVLGVMQDYTDMRKLEDESRISKQTKILAELGGSLAHEIRNPLASIRGALEVLRSNNKDKEVLHFIELALKESTRLNDIVTDFLNFAQFIPTKRNRIKASEIVNETVASVLPKIEEKKIEIIRREKDFFILGDLEKLKAGMANIILNAIEASSERGKITISTYTEKKEGIIETQDQGKGIPESLKKKIYEPFFTTKKGGTGLGLAIALNIINAHNGRLELKPSNDGTVFRIILPRA